VKKPKLLRRARDKTGIPAMVKAPTKGDGATGKKAPKGFPNFFAVFRFLSATYQRL